MRSSCWSLFPLAVIAPACDPQILVWVDPGASSTADGSAEANSPDGGEPDGNEVDSPGEDGGLTPLVVPWSTGFENAPGDTWEPQNQGSCYASGGATFQIVTAPVHSGQHAAAFTVDTSLASPSQTRCIEQGVLPKAAYYGAWYSLAASAANSGNWNLVHFQGANTASGATAHGLWDISLSNASDGTLRLAVFDFLRTRSLPTTAPVPVGTWFHLEVFLQRASDAMGRFTLRLDSQVVLDLTALPTDDSLWGQWFVGNYATALSPGVSTAYVDDVTIAITP
jgi:hypothetical protein